MAYELFVAKRENGNAARGSNPVIPTKTARRPVWLTSFLLLFIYSVHFVASIPVRRYRLRVFFCFVVFFLNMLEFHAKK